MNQRLLQLRAIFKLLVLIGVLAFVFVWLIGVFSPQQGPKLLLREDISNLSEGEMRLIEWSGREVLVLRRSAAMLAADSANKAQRFQSLGNWSEQPKHVDPEHRGLTASFFVAFAQGTDLNCALEFVPLNSQADWPGGFMDTCRGSRYDFSGHVLKAQFAKRNLAIPEHKILENRVLVLGRSD